MTSGIHHVTLVTRRVQANVDFYVGFLGLRLVKRTGGYADPTQLHLFYGDRTGSPGTLLTFLVWEDGASGRAGHGQVGEVALSVPKESLGHWLTRAMEHRVPHESPGREFGETVLRLKDPDGVIVKLVGVEAPEGAAPEPIRIRAVTLLTEKPEETAAFVARFGYRPGPREGAIQRMISETDALDVRDATGFYPGVAGTGAADHVAFRAPDEAAVRALAAEFAAEGAETSLRDRQYFFSFYVREPGGSLIECASDGPGFLLDEPEESLGTQLFFPPRAAGVEDLAAMLPQFALPGEPRRPRRDLPFVHRFRDPEGAEPDGSTLILLHGSAGMEADLMPFAARVAPRATLLGLRGRSTEEGSHRWFRRLPGRLFDQADLRAEAEALVWTLEEAQRAYGLDPERVAVLGWSNGANILGAAMLLHPGAIRRAALLRPQMVLEADPGAAPAPAEALLLTGASDPSAEPLAEALRRAGASAELRQAAFGHALTPGDEEILREWLKPA